MKILLCQEADELRERVHFAVESSYGAQVTDAPTIETALVLLRKPELGFDLVILDMPAAKPAELKSFFASNRRVPVLACVQGGDENKSLGDDSIAGLVEKSALIQNLNDSIDRLIEDGLLPKPSTDQNYCRIRTKLLLSVCPLKGDIYIRLSEWKYVKLFREGDVFDLADMERYTVKKGVEYLFLRKEQSREFIEKYTADLRKMLQVGNLGIDMVSRTGETAHETVRELGRRLGFTKEVQELAKTQIQLTLKSIGRSPSLADMINRMRSAKGEYLASHSTACGYLACAIAAQMEWASEGTYQKLTLAAFLHDISLHNQELAECQTLADLETKPGRFTAEDVREFKAHPLKGSEIAKQFSEVPPDVDAIILQHHELPDATGFPRGLGQSYIAPLAAVFIIAHDLTRYTLHRGASFEMASYLNEAYKKYKSSQFRKILAAMEKL